MPEKPYLIQIESAGLRLALHVEHLNDISRTDQLRFYQYIQSSFDSMNPPLPMDLSTKNEFACHCAIRSVSCHLARHVAGWLNANNDTPESDTYKIMQGLHRGIWSNAISEKFDEKDGWRTADMKAFLASKTGQVVLKDAAVPPKLVIPSFLVAENSVPHTTADFDHWVFEFKLEEDGKEPPFELAKIMNTDIAEFEVFWVAPEGGSSDSDK
ncbi:hypothetical protein MMC27_008085 [Xylographa pallens]|nr:hypothetical protein [Xylographa pallens]